MVSALSSRLVSRQPRPDFTLFIGANSAVLKSLVTTTTNDAQKIGKKIIIIVSEATTEISTLASL